MRRMPLIATASVVAAVGALLSTAATGSAAAPLSSAAVASVPADLTLVQVRQSLLGSHSWYAQTYRGVPVLGGFYAVHSTGASASVDDGRRVVTGLTSVSPGVARSSAATAAKGHGNARSSRLVVVPGAAGASATLAWQVTTDQDKQVLVDASSGRVTRVTDERVLANGSGKVFDPNPVVALQNESLKDANNADSAVPASAYTTVTLANLDGSGYLKGSWANVTNSKKGKNAGAFSSSLAFAYTRSDTRFEQVNSYYAVDRVQTYIQGLGFADVNHEAQDLSINTTTQDNSWYTPSQDTITVGTGGVDDGEDQEVVWHEYGHAVQDDQVPGFGSGSDAGAIGEGFGDYLAATMSQGSSADTATTPWACVMDWDSTSYTSTTPHCIRRLDTTKTVANRTGEVHADGEIWSHALWDVNKAFGRDKATRIILEAQFSYAPTTTWAAAAQKTVDAATALYGSTDAATVRAAFQARGIL
ncbi:M4 family metallopeptidase [Terrabacter sp. Soil810]|uniref:M4 family metallopeptidase n=1 Tax=Terrabacter sp. Soil810 TaxID=1736418 RepID=UPI00070ABA46|nr:M4 family metallopeptidase [Terrabacter sp. Soil810]KRF38223.1 bacillolysin [Terrabacter sp. Soil810]